MEVHGISLNFRWNWMRNQRIWLDFHCNSMEIDGGGPGGTPGSQGAFGSCRSFLSEPGPQAVLLRFIKVLVCSPCRDFHWNSMEIQWISLKFHWNSMQIQWGPLDIHRNAMETEPISLNFYRNSVEIQWTSLNFHCTPLEIQSISLIFYWNSIGINGFHLISIETRWK